MAHKCQSIVIGIGAIGEQVVDQFLVEYGRVERVDADPLPPDDVAVVTLGERESSDPRASGEGIYGASDEVGLLDAVANAFRFLLGRRPVRDFGHTYYLDVFLCGAWRDDEFRFYLPLILPYLERLAHERYGSIFSGREDIRNCRFMVHPLTLSVNMPRENARDEIAPMLTRIREWHRGLADRGGPIIPRFFIYDGFTNNIQLNDAEIVDITANFLGLCTRAGVRAESEFRRLLNFNAYAEDFFSVLNLATLHFPREYFHDRTRKIIARQFYELVSEKPDLSHRSPRNVLPDPERMRRFIREGFLKSTILKSNRDAAFFQDRISDILGRYDGKIDPDSPALEPYLRALFDRRRTFPEDAATYAPETLERYFDRHWLGHLHESCFPPAGTGISAAFNENAERIRALWCGELGDLLASLRENLEKLLGPGLGNYSLANFAAALKGCKKAVDEADGELSAAQESLPQRRWRFSAVRSLWARMRTEIWNFVPKHAVFWWLPLFAVLSSVQLLAIFRFILTRVNPNTPGAAMMRSLDTHPLFLPLLILVSLLVSVPLLWLFYLVKRRRLKRFLDTGLTDTGDDIDEFLDDDSPTLLGAGGYRGLFPSAGSLMSRKSGLWWYKHQKLGALGLVRGLLRLVKTRLREVEATSERVLHKVEEIVTDETLFSTRPLRASLYFNDYLINPVDAEWFAQEINQNLSIKISAQNVAGRLHREGVDEFLQATADRSQVFAEVEKEIPFFQRGSVFALPAIEQKVNRSLGEFLQLLPDRLSHGQIFHFLAAEEQDKLIEDTQILIVCPPEARTNLEYADREALSKFRLIVSSERDHLFGLRVIRDVSIVSMIRYLYPDQASEQVEAMMRAWNEPLDQTSAVPEPWGELQVGT